MLNFITSRAGRTGNRSEPDQKVFSAQFGDDVLLYTSGPVSRSVTGRKAGPARGINATRKQLHVVVQNGRLFQQHHPRVPVIHDRGRFLLVKLDPRRARELQGNETCYGILPLEENHVVFEASGRAARASVAFVKKLVDLVARKTFEANLTALASFKTRHSTSELFVKAATFVRQHLDDQGFQTRLQQVDVAGKPSRNVIADKQGKGAGPRRVVLVTAHLDSINLQGGPAAPAPGADDNGSGSAGVLEIARVFKSHRSAHDLRLILFGGEEQGLFGSKRYVASLSASERARIRAVVNMDMIATVNKPPRTVLLEGAPMSQTVIDGLNQAASTYTKLKVETALNPFNSDHVPFIKAGIPAVLTIEGSDSTNSNVHSAKDALAKIDFQLALDILRMNVAFVAAEIGNG